MKEKFCKICGKQPVVNKHFELCQYHNELRLNGGKTKQQVLQERAVEQRANLAKDLIQFNRDRAERKENRTDVDDLKKRYSINKVSSNNKYECSDGTFVTQVEIKKKLSETYFKIDQERQPVCQGCGQFRALSHSHIISQARCKQLHKTELIWHPENIQFHCFNDSCTCHEKWEGGQPLVIVKMLDFERNMLWLEQHDPETYNKLIVKFDYV